MAKILINGKKTTFKKDITVLDLLKKYNIKLSLIGKIQVSAALKILFDNENDDMLWDELAKFNEPTYLHQVTEYNEGVVKTHSDLPIVLENKKSVKELRAHFHVPIFLLEQLLITHFLKSLDMKVKIYTNCVNVVCRHSLYFLDMKALCKT